MQTCSKLAGGVFAKCLAFVSCAWGPLLCDLVYKYIYSGAENADFVIVMQAVRDFTEAVNKKLGINMYPYSIFHIFFEQYLYVVKNSIRLLGGALLGVFAVCCLFTSSIWASSIILLVVGMILIDLLGVMYLWDIQLNAVSVVNLTMALGIAVEFCAHIVHAFLVTAGSRLQRMQAALQDMGASVLSGITITKFVGTPICCSCC